MNTIMYDSFQFLLDFYTRNSAKRIYLCICVYEDPTYLSNSSEAGSGLIPDENSFSNLNSNFVSVCFVKPIRFNSKWMTSQYMGF